MIFTRIGKREARARYDAGETIAMAGEPWWFDDDRECEGFDLARTGGCPFDELHTARGDATYSYAKPVEADTCRACDAPLSTGYEYCEPCRGAGLDDWYESRRATVNA